jgi:SAM-dependent methyltransferase
LLYRPVEEAAMANAEGEWSERVARWVDAVPGLRLRLEAGGTVLDLECGDGAAAIAVALAFPRARVFGFDGGEERLVRARRRAREAGVEHRVRFAAVDWMAMPAWGFELINAMDLVFESTRRTPLLTSIVHHRAHPAPPRLRLAV